MEKNGGQVIILTKRRRENAVVVDTAISSVGSWGFVSLLLLYTGVALCAFAFVAFIGRDQLFRASKTYAVIVATAVEGDRLPSRRDIYGRRRIPPFQREGIVVPDRGTDTRDCDDLRKPVECNAHEGYVACFACIESRLSLRVCSHVDRDIVINDGGDDDDDFILPANKSRDLGYCMRESLARELSSTNDSSSGVDRERCSANNADWILARLRTGNDSSHNFICRCKYPHLMTNRTGPMSACDRDVGCNGHGRLDDDSRQQTIDPFVNGRCLCDEGWVAEYDVNNGGPYCREATFAEWPSRLFSELVSYDDIDLYSREIDSAFREFVAERRRDNTAWHINLPNPCDAPCRLTSFDYRDREIWFCADGIELDGAQIRRVGIAIQRDRDYLAGNGGRYPNACLVLREGDVGRNDTIALQYMSQEWNAGGARFSQEIGLLVNQQAFPASVYRLWHFDRSYERFANSLEPAKNDIFASFAMIWTYTGEVLAEARELLNERLNATFFDSVVYDPLYRSETLWFDFPYYCDKFAYKGWLCYVAGTKPPRYTVEHDISPVLCSEGRGLDWICADDDLGHRRELSEREAQLMGYGIVPICWTTTTDGTRRPEINCEHPNPTGCIFFVQNRNVIYALALSYPRYMNLRNMCCRRSHIRENNPACAV